MKNEKELLKDALNTLYDYQKLRIALENRIRAGNYTDSEHPIFKNQFNRFSDLEDEMLKYINELLKGWEIYGWLEDVKGIGPTMAAVIISQIDIYIASTVSKIWAYAGLATGTTRGYKWNKKTELWEITDTLIPIDRLTAGFRSPFNQFLRSKLIGVLGPSFLKCTSPYREHYDFEKNRLENSEKYKDEKKPGHRHNMAIRKMVKMFLIDLYKVWREMEGLPVREPYSGEYLGKKHSA